MNAGRAGAKGVKWGAGNNDKMSRFDPAKRARERLKISLKTRFNSSLGRLAIEEAAQPCRAAGCFGVTHGTSAAHQGTAMDGKALGALIVWMGKGNALQGALVARQKANGWRTTDHRQRHRQEHLRKPD
ncbi:hypothetical protein [Mesorhizobium sp. M7A.T.Ca.US.000.02.2.1]|uniref:hypothetical protein n=1 Tax=Mesorhizobium sp. M7A.T.Ca.US.000.02.2.1 TaxID=2496793 RepID=UPI000FD3D952|nr:hypothetical protein [Mesorhizobium sp. M7A.T.Ca.US.000.02.2.1]RUT81898.1 hypothetical protein EOD15_32325 [Mesorhizobium sp. M7A.T.Ca.US.000.02.2.1]